MLPPSTAKRVLAAYRGSVRAQAHVLSRMVTCPVTPVVQQLPPAGQILDVGCGHGLFSLAAALQAPERTLLGVDIDEEKVELATIAAKRLGLADRARFRLDDGRVPQGHFDAVMCNDVLYLLGRERARALLADMAASVAPGGVLLVKDMAERPAWKVRWCTLQEVLATRVLRYTEGEHLELIPPAEIEAPLRDAGLEIAEIPLDRWYPHPHLLITATAPMS